MIGWGRPLQRLDRTPGDVIQAFFAHYEVSRSAIGAIAHTTAVIPPST